MKIDEELSLTLKGFHISFEKLLILSFVYSVYEVAAHESQKICAKFHAEKVCLNGLPVLENLLGPRLRVEGLRCLREFVFAWGATNRFKQMYTKFSEFEICCPTWLT